MSTKTILIYYAVSYVLIFTVAFLIATFNGRCATKVAA